MPQTPTKTAIFDSSVWVAYYLVNDLFHHQACKIIEQLNDYQIILTKIIDIEVLNVLKRRGLSMDKIEQVQKNMMRPLIIRPDLEKEQLIYHTAYSQIAYTALKTLDLLVYSSVLVLQPNYFYSFDNRLIQQYEKSKKHSG